MALPKGVIWASVGDEQPTAICVFEFSHPELGNREFAAKLRECADVFETEGSGGDVPSVDELNAIFGGDAPDVGA